MFLPVLRLSTFFRWPSRDLPGQRLPPAGLWRRLGRSGHRFVVQTCPTCFQLFQLYQPISAIKDKIEALAPCLLWKA